MTTVAEAFGHDMRQLPFPKKVGVSELLPRADRLIGVEIELENFSNRASLALEDGDMFRYWARTHDGSLREPSVEIVLRKPLVGAELEQAIRAAYEWIARYDLRSSGRTGVHIHVDVRDKDIRDIVRICSAYTIFEQPLFEWAGAHRKDNLFCISWADANNHLRRIGRAFRFSQTITDPEMVRHEWRQTMGDDIRYSALNLKSLSVLGTLEFRHLETPRDMQVMLNWIGLIQCLVHYGSLHEIQDQLEQVSAIDPNDLGREVFGPLVGLLAGTDSWNPNSLRESARLAQDFLVFSQREGVPPEGGYEESSFVRYFNQEKEIV